MVTPALDKITGFIWQKKRPRIRFKTLQLPKPNNSVISQIYDLFLSINVHDSTNIKHKWETELQ